MSGPVRAGPAPASRPRRAVVLVPNTIAPYSRGLRVARSLAAEGFEVEIAAIAGEGLPAEERDGEVTIRRYGRGGRWARWARPPAPPGAGARLVAAAHRALTRVAPPLRGVPAPTPATLRKVLFWPLQPRGWWTVLRRDLEPADLYHACGYLAIGGALQLAARARRDGREGRVVYDVIDAVLDSNNYSAVPRPLVDFYRLKERRWARRADAVVTVNEPLAEHLARSWRLPVPPTVLLNTPRRWSPPAERPDRIRAATGIPAQRRVVLHIGKLVREKGVEEAAEAVLLLDDAALVLLGFGLLADAARERDRDPRYAGRHFLLPPVHPDELPLWTVSADVSLVGMPANSLNQRLATPNKFWESITAGTPLVVGRDLEYMRGIVERERIGSVADPRDPADLARAFREVLELPADEYAAMRARCLALAAERYNWETSVVPYLQLVRRVSR